MKESRTHALVTRTRDAHALATGRILLLLVFIVASAPLALAQSNDDYNKLEVYGGYSLGRFESVNSSLSFTSQSAGSGNFTDLCSAATGQAFGQNSQKFFCERRNFNGFDGSITYNVTRHFGIKADVTGHYKSEHFVDLFTPPGITQVTDTREHIYNFLGGVQVKNNSKTARFKPFAHALAGIAHYFERTQQTLDLLPDFNFIADLHVTAFALKLGGGLDLRLSKHLDVRVFEFDYNPIFAGDGGGETISGPFTFSSTGKTAHNYTFGFGIVIH